jgi:hypothetical protein
MQTLELKDSRTSGLGNTFLNFHSIRGARLAGVRFKEFYCSRDGMRKIRGGTRGRRA